MAGFNSLQILVIHPCMLRELLLSPSAGKSQSFEFLERTIPAYFMYRSDTILTTLGARGDGIKRLWLEDSYGRLSANGFFKGTGFVLQNRMGPGVNIRPSLISRTHVSARRGAAILSYEGAGSLSNLSTSMVRVKMSVNLVQVFPSLREFSVRIPNRETWTVDGSTLITPAGSFSIVDGLERVSGRPTQINVNLTKANIAPVTLLISRYKPDTIQLLQANAAPASPAMGQLNLFSGPDTAPNIDLSSSAISSEVARQFFTACGWSLTSPGCFAR